ncbi:MAG: diguanylate phosphodiesterase [Chloroflexota bacterium]|nr:ABC transporter substrate-binding protein [Chloroflexota bacterium]GIK63806.1 MAG: diguanylate phosphodiesterase [Chloroflexota bacterium]
MKRVVAVLAILLLVLTLLISQSINPKFHTIAQAEKPVIRIAYDGDIDHIELMQFRSISAYEATANLYEPLLTQVTFTNPRGEIVGLDEVEGSLAERYEISEDGTTFTFYLRREAKFADGTPITAHDFKYTFDRAITGPGYLGLLIPFMAIDSADQIQVLDDYTLQISTNEPAALTETILTFQIFGAISEATASEHATSDDPWAEQYFHQNANSSGPYQITHWEQGEEYVFEPNPNYWRGETFFQNAGVVFKVVPDAETREAMLQAGEVDIALGIPFSDLGDLLEDPNLAVHAIPSGRIYHLGMNNAIAPFDDARVRQAISMAIPYNAMIENVLYGYGQQPKSPVSIGMEGYTDEFWTYGDADLEEARALLETAGYGNGFVVDLTVPEEDQTRLDAAEWIKVGLERLGITVNINAVSTAEFSELLFSHELPFFIEQWYSWGNDPFFQLTFNLKCGAVTNYVNYCNEEVDALIEAGTFSRDAEERADLIRRAQEIIVEEAPWAYLYQPDRVFVTRANVTGIAIFNDLTLRYAYLGITE